MRLFSLLLIALLFTCFAPSAPAQGVDLPPEIARYYEDYSFVVAFSTPGERYRLTRFSSAEEVEETTGSERLTRIWAALRRVQEQEQEVDPGMALKPEKTRHSIPPQLIRAEGVVAVSGTELAVRVKSHELDSEQVEHFIAAYEQGVRAPSGAPAAALGAPFVEVNEWVRSGGTWYRRPDSWRTLSDQ